jgi:hypothetical protein
MNNPEHLKWIVLGALVGFGASFTRLRRMPRPGGRG